MAVIDKEVYFNITHNTFIKFSLKPYTNQVILRLGTVF